jgi:hypothetical protein
MLDVARFRSDELILGGGLQQYVTPSAKVLFSAR